MFRLSEGEQENHGSRSRQYAAEQENGIEGPDALSAPQVVEGHRQRWTRGQASELGGRQPAVGPAAGIIGREIRDQRPADRPNGSHTHPFEKPEDHEPAWVRRRQEEKSGYGVECHPRDDQGLAAHRIAQTSQGCRENQSSHGIGRSHQAYQPLGRVSLLIEEDR